MSSNARRHTEPVDAIWLDMDRPSNRMVIVTLVFLASCPDWEEVVRLLQRRVVERYPVFRQRPLPARLGLGLPMWEDDPEFDLSRHVSRVTLAEPGDDQALQSHVEEYLPCAMDPHHPLWEVQLVDGHGEGAVVFCRIHHALADGISLTRVLMSLTDADADGRRGHPRGARRGAAMEADVPDDVPYARHGSGVAAGVSLVRDGLGRMVGLATSPSRATTLVQSGIRLPEVVTQLLLTRSPASALTGMPSAYKRVAWSQPLSLDGLKKVAHRQDSTLNDVLMSAMAGALCRYQRERDKEPVDVVTMVPVNLRPLDQPLPASLGNRFALVFFRFPSGTEELLARLAATKRRMDWLKRSPEAALTFMLMGAIARTVSPVERFLVDFFANKAIGVTTNVAGPTAPRTLAGVPVTGVLGWVPGSGRHTLGTCIFTYAGRVQVGVMADGAVVPDPHALVRAFEDEAAALVQLGR